MSRGCNSVVQLIARADGMSSSLPVPCHAYHSSRKAGDSDLTSLDDCILVSTVLSTLVHHNNSNVLRLTNTLHRPHDGGSRSSVHHPCREKRASIQLRTLHHLQYQPPTNNCRRQDAYPGISRDFPSHGATSFSFFFGFPSLMSFFPLRHSSMDFLWINESSWRAVMMHVSNMYNESLVG